MNEILTIIDPDYASSYNIQDYADRRLTQYGDHIIHYYQLLIKIAHNIKLYSERQIMLLTEH